MYSQNAKARIMAVAATSICLASTIYSIWRNIYIAAALLGFGALINAYISRKMLFPNRKIERDTLAFLEDLTRGNDAHTLGMRIGRALSTNVIFYKDFKRALQEYNLSGDASKAFTRLRVYKYIYFEMAVLLIQDALDSGIDISYALQSLCSECAEHNAIRGKHAGEVANFKSLQFMGGVIFFPVFAGLSINVLKFSQTSIAAPVYGIFILAILCYISVINLLSVLFENSSILAKMGSISMRIAFASFIFELSNMAASTLI